MLKDDISGKIVERLRAEAERIKAAGESRPRFARDPVNLPIIRNWLEAMGDVNPVYTDPGAALAAGHGDLVAPPAMIQVWTMQGQPGHGQPGARQGADPTGLMIAALDEAGYTSVVATNSDQAYHRYLRHGERLSVTVSLVDLTGPKQTALGEGWFFTTRQTWRSVVSGSEPDSVGAGDVVATMDFRILKFRPRIREGGEAGTRGDGGGGSAGGGGGGSAGGDVPGAGSVASVGGAASVGGVAGAAGAGGGVGVGGGASAGGGTGVGAVASAGIADAGQVMRPVVTVDTAFFWEGTAAGELRIQRCGGCGALRHPPGPMCPRCGSPGQEYIVAAGTGEIFSYVVHRHPPVPGKRLPIVIALVQLDEGVRVLGELLGADPQQVEIGMPVRVCYDRIDDELTLPAWRLADERGGSDASASGHSGGTERADGSGDRSAGTEGTSGAGGGTEQAAGSGEPGSQGQRYGGGLRGELAEELPGLVVDVSTTFVVAGALATRDFTPVHHDRDRAVAGGGKDIFVNILTDAGLVQRYVTDWAGPSALVRRISLRLGVPCYAGDALRFSGRVSERVRIPGWDRYEVAVTGRCALGDHAIAAVTVEVPVSET